MSAGIDIPSYHSARNRTTISGNQVLCASPEAFPKISTSRRCHCSRPGPAGWTWPQSICGVLPKTNPTRWAGPDTLNCNPWTRRRVRVVEPHSIRNSETLSRACSLPCSPNTRSRSRSLTASRLASTGCNETSSRCASRWKPGREVN